MRNIQKKMALVLCTVLSFSMLGGCGKEQETEETAEDVAIVEAANPCVGDLTLSGEFIATINPDDSVYVIPKTTAEVMQVMVSAGDMVEEGDVLAVLDDTLAQISLKSAQISLDRAKTANELAYGEDATLLNDMQTDSQLSSAQDGVSTLQENLVDAMDSLERYKSQLADAEKELADVRKEYDYREDPDEIKDYAESIDRDSLEGINEYQAAMARYQTAVSLDAQWQGKIDGYKQAIDKCEESIETLQDQIDSSYESYSQAVVSSDIKNGEMREMEKEVSQTGGTLNISAAQLQVEQAQEGLEAYTITAAISGVIETVNIKEHDFATTNNPAFVISNKDSMVATYYVSEDVRNTFSTGQMISVEKDGEVYQGEVIEIGSTLDTTTGLFRIKAAIKGDTAQMLSGTKAKVITDTYHEKDALIIPYDAVYYDGTQAYVYTIVDGKARKTNVTTGLYDVDNIVITEGITEDDVVITTWSAQLREGVAVSVRESKTADETQE